MLKNDEMNKNKTYYFKYLRTTFFFLLISSFAGTTFAYDKNFVQLKAKSIQGIEITYNATIFNPGEYEEFNAFYKTVTHLDQNVATRIVFQTSEKIDDWSAPFEKGSVKDKIAIPVEPRGKIDKVGAIVASVRTIYSTVFWVFIGDFDWLQSTAMFGLQAAIHYSFTYKGWGLNILQHSLQLGNTVLDRLKYTNLKESHWYKNGIKYFSGFMTSNILGVGFMGIIAWDEFIQTFSGPSVYYDIAFYSVMGLFATGGWNNFLSEQKFSSKRLMSLNLIHRIYQTNGVLMAIAFPLMMNSHTSGTLLLGTVGISGIVMMYKGQDFLENMHKVKRKAQCYQLYWELLKQSRKH